MSSVECGRRNAFAAFPVPAIAFCLPPQFFCVLHVTAGSRIVRAVSKCSWMSFACAVLLCFDVLHMTAVHRIVSVFRYIVFCKGVPRQSHCNCNENGVHVSLFLLLTAFICLLKL